ncbi:MAG: hypothetical protein LBQ42_13040 [Synergistaceae bacterium]|jgi:hypothetical protein|nr:hypothetical protein [Synergistaceae bacterium]
MLSGKKRKNFFRALLGAAAGLGIFLWNSPDVLASPFEETIRILENSTSFHWGRDCLVWIVYYPEELVDPWVDAEAGRVGMTESERESYKEGFVSELSIGKLEPFLLTVYVFGPRPLDFSPISEKIALVTAEGERVKPARYDRAFDQPISGVVQGLVFFPKQRSRDFALAVQGMGVYHERIFAFSSQPPMETALADTDAPEENIENADVVIVDLPPSPAADESAAPPAKAPEPKPKPKPTPKRQEPKVIERPQNPPPPERVAEPEIVVIEPEESQSMAEFVEAMRSGDRRLKETESGEGETREADNLYASREKTVRAFLDLWMKHDPETMYSMLSEGSQKLFSRETFESDLRKASDFRGALQEGYTIEWLGTERAKVVAVKRILLIRTLIGRTLGVVREGSAWKIVW